MRVFVTGASGWIGSATVDELLGAGHEVVGLVRSDASATALTTKGATVLRGDLDDLDGLRRGATDADAVVHLANKHDWANQRATNAAERTAVETLTGALKNTDTPFVLASGLANLAKGRPATESDPSPAVGLDSMRGGSENLALDQVGRGVRTVIARFAPTTHGAGGDHGFIAMIVAAARARGVSGYVGDGTHSWAATHVRDTAGLIRLGLERAPAGTVLHAVAEPAVATKQIAEAIGDALGLPTTSIDPDDAVEHFGVIGRFFALDLSATADRTRDLLGWAPTGPTLLEDIAAGAYTS